MVKYSTPDYDAENAERQTNTDAFHLTSLFIPSQFFLASGRKILKLVAAFDKKRTRGR
jgi:hypothetical protein